MKFYAVWGLTALSALGLGGCSGGDDDVPVRESLTGCDAGRRSTLHIARDVVGAVKTVAVGDDGFLLFGRGRDPYDSVVHAGHAGLTLEEHPNPSRLAPFIQDVRPGADGHTFLSGTLDNGRPNDAGWVGAVSPEWSLDWEASVGPPYTAQVLVYGLPDGGAIVAGTTFEDETADQATNDDRDDAFWARLDSRGNIVWDHRVRFPGSSPALNWWARQTLSVGADQRLRFVVQSDAGLVLVSCDLDGENELQQLLDTRLALGIVGVVGLPDGRLVIASQRSGAVLTMVDADATVEWERTYGTVQQVSVESVAFDATHNELVMAGSSAGGDSGWQRLWLLGTDLDGQQAWTVEKKPPLALPHHDGDYITLEPGRGPGLVGVAAAPDGTLLATAQNQAELSYFVMTPEVCHE